MFSHLKKKHFRSTSAPDHGLTSSQVTHQPQPEFPANSQSQSPQEKQQSQPVWPWSTLAPPFGQSQSPFLRSSHTLSQSVGEDQLFLFGGYSQSSKSYSNDLYVISTRDFSTILLQTGGDIPSPRYGHGAVLTGTILLILGGRVDSSKDKAQNQNNDDSLYMLNLALREWTRIVVNGPGPGARHFHTMTLVGSKIFVFGGASNSLNVRFNDIWALDLDCLTSNPRWESCEPAPGNVRPLPRSCHVSVTTGDRIIVFGGSALPKRTFNDTWSFNISTRKWTELQCTGSIPTPRGSHAAVLVDGVMFVFGGRTIDGAYLGDLNALNLSTLRWTAFEDIGPSPCRRTVHAMASDRRRVFVLGGKLPQGVQVGEAKPIHVLDTELLIYPKTDSDIVKDGERTTQFAQKLSAGRLTQSQLQKPTPSSDAHGASPFQEATPGELDYPTPQPEITREQNPSLNDLSSRPTRASGRPRHVSEEDDEGRRSTEHSPKLVAPDTPSGKEFSRLDHGRLVELERQLSETLVAKTERDRHIAQLKDELALKSALLERAEANAAEEKNRAGLELREMRAKLDELLLSHDQAEANAVEEKKRAGQELRELQAKLDESLLSRNHALEQAQSALQKASCSAQANEQSQRELTEVHAKLEARESELMAFRSRPPETDNGWAKGKAEADTYRNQNTTGLVNTDEDRVIHRLMERMQVMEAEIASLRWNEKSFEMMECRNEG